MNRKTGRYAAQGPEAEFEPGSRGRVLRTMSALFSAVIRRSYDCLERSRR